MYLLATNSQLVLDNSHLQAQKFGANLIQHDNKKTLFYTGLPTYKIFSTLFYLLQLLLSLSAWYAKYRSIFCCTDVDHSLGCVVGGPSGCDNIADVKRRGGNV